MCPHLIHRLSDLLINVLEVTMVTLHHKGFQLALDQRLLQVLTEDIYLFPLPSESNLKLIFNK